MIWRKEGDGRWRIAYEVFAPAAPSTPPAT